MQKSSALNLSADITPKLLLFVFICAFLNSGRVHSQATLKPSNVASCADSFLMGPKIADTTVIIGRHNLSADPTIFTALDSKSYISLFTHSTGYLSLIDLASFEIVQSADLLEYARYLSISGPITFARYNSDLSLMIQTGESIYIVKDSLINYQFHLPGSLTEEVQPYYTAPTCIGCNPIYDPTNGKLRLCVTPYYRARSDGSHYLYPYMEYVTDTIVDSFQVVPVKRSNVNISQKYGFADEYYRTAVGSKSIYSFQVDPSILIYDDQSQTVDTLQAHSRHASHREGQLELADSSNYEKLLQHLVAIDTYSPVAYNPITSEYYRILYVGMELEREDGSINTFADQESYLQVFDAAFCLIDEVKLMTGIHSSKVFPGGEGYIVYHIRQDADSPFHYSKIYRQRRLPGN